MSFESLLSKIRKKEVSSYYYFIEENPFFSHHLVEEIKIHFLQKVTQENFVLCYAKELNIERFIENIATTSLFSSKKLILCKEADSLTSKQIESFFRFLSSSEERNDICVIFLASKKSSHALYRHCQRMSRLFEFKKPYDRELPTWIQWIVKKHNKKIEPKAILLVAEKMGQNLMHIQQEIEKMSLYIGSKETIEEEEIRTILCSTKQYSIFELTDAIGNKEKQKALLILQKMLEEGESEVFIFSMIMRFLRNMWKAVEWKETKSDTEVQKELGIHPFFWKDFRRQRDLALKMPFSAIWKKASHIDKKLKTTQGDKGGLLTQFVYLYS